MGGERGAGVRTELREAVLRIGLARGTSIVSRAGRRGRQENYRPGKDRRDIMGKGNRQEEIQESGSGRAGPDRQGKTRGGCRRCGMQGNGHHQGPLKAATRRRHHRCEGGAGGGCLGSGVTFSVDRVDLRAGASQATTEFGIRKNIYLGGPTAFGSGLS